MHIYILIFIGYVACLTTDRFVLFRLVLQCQFTQKWPKFGNFRVSFAKCHLYCYSSSLQNYSTSSVRLFHTLNILYVILKSFSFLIKSPSKVRA